MQLSIEQRLNLLAVDIVRYRGPVILKDLEAAYIKQATLDLITPLVNNLMGKGAPPNYAMGFIAKYMSCMVWNKTAWVIDTSAAFNYESFYGMKPMNSHEAGIFEKVHAMLAASKDLSRVTSRFKVLVGNCMDLATGGRTKNGIESAYAYLNGKIDLGGLQVDRSIEDLLKSIDVQYDTGTSPDLLVGYLDARTPGQSTLWNLNNQHQPIPHQSEANIALGTGTPHVDTSYTGKQDPAQLQELELSKVTPVSSVGDLEFYFIRDDVHYVIARAYGTSPTGNPYFGAWVCFEHYTGKYIDHDKYRTDLFERLNLKVS